MWTKLPFLCSFAAIIQIAAWAQTDDPKDLLLRVRGNVTDTVARLPKYMCSLTIEREQYTADPVHALSCDGMAAQRTKGELKPHLYETDRVRLDVGVAASNEIYSWVGEDRFDDRDLFDLVREGALQTGSFSGFLTSIFGSDAAANFTYDGETEWEGRMLLEFGFQVPLDQSHYTFSNRHGKQVVTGYEGEFLADPNTGDLVRLTIRTNGDLRDTGACESTTTLRYSRVRLYGSEFLLPRETRLDILNTDGSEFRNRTEYANCHEFRGESTLKFDAPSPEASSTPVKTPTPSPLALPAGLKFKLVFSEAINTGTAATGDRIKAKLASAIRNESSKSILIPEGAEVTARIGGLQHYVGPPSSVTLLVKLEAVEVGGRTVPLAAAKASQVEPLNHIPASRSQGLRQRVPLGTFASLANSKLGLFEFRNVKPNFVIKSGLESTWTTVEPEHQRGSSP
jgi:hypothetical protein